MLRIKLMSLAFGIASIAMFCASAGADSLLVSSYGHTDYSTGDVMKIDLETHALTNFIPFGTGGLQNPEGLIRGLNGNLLVISAGTGSVKEYNFDTGAYVKDFATGLSWPRGACFGPDNNLYVASQFGNKIVEFDGQTGQFIKNFASLSAPEDVAYRDGIMYASTMSGSVVKYDFQTGASTGTLTTGLYYTQGMNFGPDGYLYAGADDGLYKIDTATGARQMMVTGTRMEDVIFSPDGQLLFTNQFDGHNVTSYSMPGVTFDENVAQMESPTYMLYVPEPGTICLMVFGSLALLRRKFERASIA